MFLTNLGNVCSVMRDVPADDKVVQSKMLSLKESAAFSGTASDEIEEKMKIKRTYDRVQRFQLKTLCGRVPSARDQSNQV